jgi:phosphatidylserine decarboxylase precursor
VLSFGEVDSLRSTMDCIKGHTYRVDEFLFGYKIERDPANPQLPTMTESIIQSAKARGNKVMFAVIYLAPQDYHRYHSPAHFTANYRRHIAGYLEPVMPSYLKKHKDVLKENERVNVLGEWTHGFFAMSFIGALNVGSIKLLFDDSLKSNAKSPAMPYFLDRNYQTLAEAGGSFLSFPVRHKTQAPDQPSEDERLSVVKYLNEFDIKDVIDIGSGATDLKYEPALEHKLSHNILNGFRRESVDQAS